MSSTAAPFRRSFLLLRLRLRSNSAFIFFVVDEDRRVDGGGGGVGLGWAFVAEEQDGKEVLQLLSPVLVLASLVKDERLRVFLSVLDDGFPIPICRDSLPDKLCWLLRQEEAEADPSEFCMEKHDRMRYRSGI